MYEATTKFATFRICPYILNQRRSTPTEKLKNRRTYGKILRFERGIHISMKNCYFHNFDKRCYSTKYQARKLKLPMYIICCQTCNNNCNFPRNVHVTERSCVYDVYITSTRRAFFVLEQVANSGIEN